MKGDSSLKVKTKIRYSWQKSSRSSATIHAANVISKPTEHQVIPYQHFLSTISHLKSWVHLLAFYCAPLTYNPIIRKFTLLIYPDIKFL